jgi:phage tail-like protein
VLGDDTRLGMANRFSVRIDRGPYDLGSWSHADGLDVAWDVAEYRAGDGGNSRWYFPGNAVYSKVRLTRATCRDSRIVQRWLEETSFAWTPSSGRIGLHDSAGELLVSWQLEHLMPVKWSVTGFDATAGRVATESLELAHRGFLDDARALG